MFVDVVHAQRLARAGLRTTSPVRASKRPLCLGHSIRPSTSAPSARCTLACVHSPSPSVNSSSSRRHSTNVLVVDVDATQVARVSSASAAPTSNPPPGCAPSSSHRRRSGDACRHGTSGTSIGISRSGRAAARASAREDLAVRGDGVGQRRRQLVADLVVQRRERVVGHAREHVVLDVVVHVQVEEPEHRVHEHGAGCCSRWSSTFSRMPACWVMPKNTTNQAP